jgi:hypothetical protein
MSIDPMKLQEIIVWFLACVSLLGITMPAAAFTVPVPEPDTLLLLVAGVAAVFLAGKFRGRK